MTQLCVSVDVEEDLPGMLPRSTLGIDEGLPRLLGILEEFNVIADFFVLSSIAVEKPKLVQEVVDAGHTVGNHGLNHGLLCAMSVEGQRFEIESSSADLQRVLGNTPRTYRAANFSVNTVTLKLLEELGYRIDSSVLPGRVLRRSRIRKIYDHRNAPPSPFYPFASRKNVASDALLEIPLTGNPLRRGAPLGLGGVNTFGPGRTIAALRSIETEVATFLIHPWELVNLSSMWPSLPSGYGKACSANLDGLRDFLTGVQSFSRFSTLEAVARDLH